MNKNNHEVMKMSKEQMNMSQNIHNISKIVIKKQDSDTLKESRYYTLSIELYSPTGNHIDIRVFNDEKIIIERE